MCDCSLINPKKWDGKRTVWKDKPFLMSKVVQFMHTPLNMGSVINKMFSKIKAAKAETATKDFLMLAYDPSPWVSEIYMNVTKDIPGENIVRLSGTFMTKVFDGPFNAVPKWINEMDSYLASMKLRSMKYYFFFTMCPKCIKETGHNYCIVFAQVK